MFCQNCSSGGGFRFGAQAQAQEYDNIYASSARRDRGRRRQPSIVRPDCCDERTGGGRRRSRGKYEFCQNCVGFGLALVLYTILYLLYTSVEDESPPLKRDIVAPRNRLVGEGEDVLCSGCSSTTTNAFYNNIILFIRCTLRIVQNII